MPKAFVYISEVILPPFGGYIIICFILSVLEYTLTVNEESLEEAVELVG